MTGNNAGAGLSAGVGVADITRRAGEAIDDPLFVRALVLDDGARKLALITIDVVAIGCRTLSRNLLCDSADDFVPVLRERLQTETGIPGENVTVCASHVHARLGHQLCGDQAQLDKTLEAVRQARRTMTPVTAGVAAGREDRLTFNRTLMMKNGLDYTIRACNPLPPDGEVEALRPIDPEIGVLRIDRLDGRPLAVVYNFAAHVLIGSPKGGITAGFPAFTTRCLEESLGHDAMAFFIQGAGGDIAEISVSDLDCPRSSRQIGEALGQSVLQAYRRIKTAPADLQAVSKTVAFPLRTDIPARVAELRREQAELRASLRYTGLNFKTFLPLYLKYHLFPDFPAHAAYRYRHADQTGDDGFRALDRRNRLAVEKYLESLAAMEKMARNEEKIAMLDEHREIIAALGGATLPAEIHGIRIGDCVFVAAPMEVLAETGLRVKQASPFRHTFIASLANGDLDYAPPSSYYPRGGYEATATLLAPAWQEIFEATVRDILAQLEKRS